MPEPTFRVFVSSTWRDLEPERKAVETAVHRMRETKFVGMEYFGSRDDTTHRASLDEVDSSQVYVGIIAARYGSGITEDEYRRARERGLPCFIYLKSEATVTADKRETDADKAARLATLKEELHREHTITEFDNPNALATLVVSDLHRWLSDQYLTPKLEGALRGEVPDTEARQLIDAIKDWRDISRDLQRRLRGAGFNIASGERSAALSGEDNQAVTGDRNVVANRVQGDVVQTKNVYEATPPTVSARHQLRAPVGDFVGRENEIDGLMKALRGGGSAAISGISGMGGIGKTELALLVADRLRDDYPDAQLFIDMRGTDDQPRDPADALAACVRAFAGLEQKLPESLEDLTKLYSDNLDGKRALILLDNASDSAQVRPLLPPPGVALLVTSRNVVSLPGMKRVTLEQLPPAEARELLTSIAPRVPPDLADQICFLCGYLPLAIRAAGSLLDITADLDPAAYAAQLRDERTRLERIGTEGVDIGVEASFNLSYQRLHPEAARVFRKLAVFPATFDTAAEEYVCEDENHKRLSELLRRSLVFYDATTARYHLHDLARLFADAQLKEEERIKGRVRHAAQYLAVLRNCDEFYLQGDEAIKSGLALFDMEKRNIEAGQKYSCENATKNEITARICNAYSGVGVHVLGLRRHPRERIVWLEAALSTASQLKDRHDEACHLGSLGIAYNEMGETQQAIECFERSLTIAREMNDRHGEKQGLGNLGITYYILGEIHRAIDYHKKALKITREISDPRAEATALINLGTCYKNLGETKNALQFNEEALVVSRKIGDRYLEGQALGNIGSTYLAMGEARLAIEFSEYALDIIQEIGDHQGKGNSLINISLALYELGERARAIAHAKEALEIFEQIESRNAAGARAILDKWRRQSGKDEGAVECVGGVAWGMVDS